MGEPDRAVAHRALARSPALRPRRHPRGPCHPRWRPRGPHPPRAPRRNARAAPEDRPEPRAHAVAALRHRRLADAAPDAARARGDHLPPRLHQLPDRPAAGWRAGEPDARGRDLLGRPARLRPRRRGPAGAGADRHLLADHPCRLELRPDPSRYRRLDRAALARRLPGAGPAMAGAVALHRRLRPAAGRHPDQRARIGPRRARRARELLEERSAPASPSAPARRC